MSFNEKDMLTAKAFMTDYRLDQPLKHADRMVQYVADLQKQRLERLGVTLEKRFEPHGHFHEGNYGLSLSSEHFIQNCIYFTARTHTTVKTQDKTLYKHKQDEILYTYVTRSNNYGNMAAVPYTCPNCGTTSTIGQLEDQCPYCGTHYEISELFPKVTGYFAVEDFGGTNKEMRREVLPYILVSAIGAVLILIIYGDKSNPLTLLLLSPLLLAVAAFFGYSVYALRMIGRMFVSAGKSLPLLAGQRNSKRFARIIQQEDPDFNLNYFAFCLVSYLKLLIFSDQDTLLPFYKGQDNRLYEEVIDTAYRGAIDIKQVVIRDGMIRVSLEVFLDNLYDHDGKITLKSEKTLVKVEKRQGLKTNYNFSISQVRCEGCGGSFNSYRETKCPYCGREYDAREQDWVITEIVR